MTNILDLYYCTIEEQDEVVRMLEGSASGEDFEKSWHEPMPAPENYPGKYSKVTANTIMKEIEERAQRELENRKRWESDEEAYRRARESREQRERLEWEQQQIIQSQKRQRREIAKRLRALHSGHAVLDQGRHAAFREAARMARLAKLASTPTPEELILCYQLNISKDKVHNRRDQ
jgi:hypothetical protein